uniref:Uncharacterized protein n=1 Tax=Romanomermis culicivorax TaxID=13658 RepID=A0A915I7A5_ROMCU
MLLPGAGCSIHTKKWRQPAPGGTAFEYLPTNTLVGMVTPTPTLANGGTATAPPRKPLNKGKIVEEEEKLQTCAVKAKPDLIQPDEREFREALYKKLAKSNIPSDQLEETLKCLAKYG